jgi:P-type Ca2+ transporter type 2C
MTDSQVTSTASAAGGVPPYQQTAATVLGALGADAEVGLSSDEAGRRLAEHGPNELEASPETPAWRRFLAQFEDTLVQLLLVATVVSTVVWWLDRHDDLPYDAIVILAIVIINAVLGFVQEQRAARAVAALKEMTARHATVIRDGRHRDVFAAEVVPGDLLVLSEGDAVAADARVIEVAELRTVEGALTGESLPSHKRPDPLPDEAAIGDRHNMVFTGTAVSSGRGRAVVTATGMRTEIGHIAGMLDVGAPPLTPLQRDLDRVGRRLGQLVIAIAVVVAIAILVTQPHAFDDRRALVDVLLLAVALAVAAVPEGLPAIVTSTLAIGVRRIARRNAIIRELPAVETLGSATIIASDKTGTLTRNQMTVRTVVTASGRAELTGIGWDPTGEVAVTDGGVVTVGAETRRALTAAALCNDAHLVREADGAWTVLGDPTEGALLTAARKADLELERLAIGFPRVAELPFTSERKRMATAHREGDRVVLFVKGAADLVLDRCTRQVVATGDELEERPLDNATRARLTAANEALTRGALRTLAVAVRDLGPADDAPPRLGPGDEEDLAFVGLIGMLDPPRPAAAPAVARARAAGIRPLVITGDHPATAVAIATEVGVVGGHDAPVLLGREIEALDDDELAGRIDEVSVFARVDPVHKLRLVQVLQARGEVVAMTGDGVNDAPALQTADIGVAMGITGTDVSKEAADMILLDDDFATIVAAVEEGRGIFDNIRKFLRYLLTSNIGEVLVMFFGVLLAGLLGLGLGAEDGTVVLPLLATQILWINLVTDGLPALALGLDPIDPDVMDRPPRPKREGVLTRSLWFDIVTLGAVMALGTLAVLDASLPGGIVDLTGGRGDLTTARTLTFTTLVVFQLVNTFICRAGDHAITVGITRNRLLWGAVAISLALQALVVHWPPLHPAFGTTALTWWQWAITFGVASTLIVANEILRRVR